MQSIRNILGAHVQKGGLTHKVQAALVVEYFEKLLDEDFGKQLRGDIRSISLKGKRLNISSHNAPLKNKIHYNEAKYIKAINAKFGLELVNSVSYSV